MVRKVLLATDGSSAAVRAVDFAAVLAIRQRTRLIVLHAYLPANGLHPDAAWDDGRSASRTGDPAVAVAVEVLQGVIKRLGELGVPDVVPELIAGPPIDAILGSAESNDVDLIVVGARGQGTWRGTHLGSVSMAVVQRAMCPVLVVK